MCRVVFVVLVWCAVPLFAATNQSLRSDDWSDNTMWSLGTVPSTTDDVKIMSGHTVNGDTVATVQTLEVEGTLDITAAQLSVDYTVTLTGGGTISGTGTLFMAGNATALMGTGTISAPVLFGTGTRTVGAGSNILVSGAVTVDGAVDNSGTISFTDAGGLAGASGTWTQNATGILKVDGPITVSTFDASTSGNTIEYEGTDQTIRATTYSNLKTVGTSETRTLGGAITVNGNLFIEGLLEDSGYQITGPGSSSGKTLQIGIASTLQIGTNNGAQPTNGTTLPDFQTYSFHSTSSVEYAARANQTISSLPPTYANLAIVAVDSPPVNLTKTAAGAITVTGDLSLIETGGSTVTFVLAGNLNVSGALVGDGDINRGTDTIFLQGSNTLYTGSITPSHSITFTGTNVQSIRAGTYDDITISKSGGSASLAGAVTVNNLTITSGIMSDGGFTLTGGAGSLNMSSSTTLRISATFPAFSGSYTIDPAATVSYEGDGNQNISLAPAYGILILTTGTTPAVKNPLAAGTLTCSTLQLTNGTAAVTLDMSGNTINVGGSVTGNGNLDITGGSLDLDGDFTNTGTFTTTGSTVTYYGTNTQSIRGTNYHDLVINKSAGTATLAGNAHANNNVSVTDGTLELASFTLDIDGDLSITDTLNINTGSVQIDGDITTMGTLNGGTGKLSLNGTTQTLNGSPASFALYDLDLNNNGTTVNHNVSIAGDLEMNGLDLSMTDPFVLTLANTATITDGCNCGIRGKLAWNVPAASLRRFELSSPTGTYLPVELTSSAGGLFTLKAFGTAHPNNTSGGLKQLGRHWEIDGATATTLALNFYWNDNTDFDGSMETFVPVFHNGSAFSFPAGSVDFNNYSMSLTGVTAYDGTWTAGAASSFGSSTPSVASFAPASGITGASVSIYGSNFTGVTSIAFNGTPVTSFTFVDDNELSTTVPAGATTGLITVTHPTNGTGTSATVFTVVVPTTHTTVVSGDWNTASTWNTNTVPATYDNAVVNHNITVNSFAEIENVDLNANLAGSDTLKFNGLMNWNSGTISATLDVGPAATLDVTAGPRALSGGTLLLQGKAELHGSVHLQNGATYTPSGSAVLEFHGDFDFKYDGTGATPTMPLSGTIRKVTGTGDSFIHCGSTCVNNGDIDVQTGAIDFSSGLTHNGGEMIFWLSGTSTSQIGRVDVSGGSLSLTGGTFDVVLNSHTPQGGATYEVLTMGSFSGDFGNSSVTFNGSRTLTRSFPDSTRMLLTASGPTISNVTPNSGTVSGGTYVEINGTGLATVTQVKFGGVAGTIIGSPTATQVKARTPANSAGSADVFVDNGEPTTLSNGFLYVNPTCTSPSGIVAWYRLEADATDAAGASPLTLSGGAYDTGKVGLGIDLNGTNEYASAADNTWLRPASLSLEGWVKFDTVPVGQYAMLFGKTAGTGTSESYGVSYKDGQLWFGTGGTGGITYQTATFTPTAGTWYHIALTFSDAADDIRLYIDGQLATQATTFTNITYDSHAFTIGTEYENEVLNFYFPGVIDEVTLYNRQLTAGEVLAIYDADTAGKCYPAAPSLVFINPTSGGTAGGTNVSIYGASLNTPSSVAFGGNAAASYTPVSQSQINAVTAAAAASTVNVQVDTAQGSAILSNAFTFAAPQTRTTAQNGNWSSPSTWTGNVVPNSGDTVEIYHTVTMDTPVSISAVKLFGGSITGSSTLTVNDTFVWDSGHLLDNTGSLVLGASCTSTVTGTSSRQLSRAITNNGTFNVDGTGQIQHADATFTNNGTLQFRTDVTWTQFGTGQINNAAAGIFNKNAGSGSTSVGVTFANNNEVNISTGTITFDGSFGSIDTVNVTSGAIVVSGGGTLSGTTNLSGGTSLTFNAGSPQLSAATIDGAGIVQVGGATLSIIGTNSVDHLTVSSGTLTGAGTLTVNDGFTWTAGSINDSSGTLNLGAACTGTISGTSARALQRVVNNAGTLTVSPSGQIQHALTTFTNSGTLNITNDVPWTDFGGGASLVNTAAGDINKSGGSGTAPFSVPFTNNGDVVHSAGTWQLGGTFANTGTVGVTAGNIVSLGGGTSTGTFNLSSGGNFHYGAGSATLDGASVNGNGIMIVNGATLTITNSVGIDRLQLDNGTLTGNGALTVDLSFDWSAGSVTGTTGSLTLGASCATTISGTSARQLQRPITNDGTVAYSASGQIQHAAAAFTNNGIFNVQSNVAWTQFGGASFTNSATGQFNKTGGTSTSTFSVPFTNAGGISSSASGTLEFSSDFSNNGNAGLTSGILALTGGSGTSTGTFTLGTGTSAVWTAGTPTLNGATIIGDGIAENNGATLTITGTVNADKFAMSNGTLTGAGTLNVNNAFGWNAGGIIDGSGSLVLGSSCASSITGTSSRQLQRNVTNNGSLTFTASGQIQHASASFTNNNTFNVQSDAAWTQFGGASFTNASGATFNKNGGTGTMAWSVPLTNSSGGAMSFTSGAATFYSDLVNAGSISVAAGIAVAINGGSGTHTGTYSITTPGSFYFAAGTYTLDGVTVNGSGFFIVDGGTVSIANTVSIDNLTLGGSGSIGGAGTLNVNDAFNWTGAAALTGSGTLNLGGTASSAISGTSSRALQRNLTNNGTLILSASGQIQHASSTFTNTSLFEIQSDAAWTNFGGAVFVNNGTMDRTTSIGTAGFGVTIDNSNGTIDVDVGTLALTGLTSTASSTLSFDIGGPAAGTNYGVLTVTSSHARAGTIDAEITNAFVPQGGTTYQVITSSGSSGSFSNSIITDGSRTFDVTSNTNNITLVAGGPTVATATPNSGTQYGGTSVVLTGTGFQGATPGEPFTGTVTFGVTNAGTVTWNSSTQLTAITPAVAPSTVNIIVTNADSQPGMLANGFTFNATAAPTITAIRPNTGNIAGGTRVLIEGTDLDSVTDVDFDTSAATIVTQTASQLEVLSPAHAAGPVTVTVTNPAGLATTSFTYDNTWDAGRDFSRTNNPNAPWTYGKKSGATFTTLPYAQAYGAQWGWNDGAGFVLPEVVSNFSGSNLLISSWSLPSLQLGMHPASGGVESAVRWTAPSAGQWQIDAAFAGIDGGGSRGVTVEINNTEVFTTTLNGLASQSGILRRSLNAGDTVDFLVSDGGNGISNDATALDATISPLTGPVVTIASVSPNIGTNGGGTSVTITGTNFHSGANVLFGGTAATSVTVDSATQITATTPAHTAGTVDVTITHNDSADATLTNGFTFSTPSYDVTTNADSGAGSLREAITKANSGHCGPNCSITFSIGSGAQTIALSTALPSITASGVTIDGTTQEGYAGTPLIDINGAGTSGQSAKGLVLAGGSATVKSLVIRNFTDAFPNGYAIHITSANNTVQGNYIGTNAAGTAASANRVGIVIDGASATNNTIGGTSAANRNILSGNTASGVTMENGASSNSILGNYIGTDVTGANDLGNGFNGVYIDNSDANVVGGSTASERNVISGNDSPNVYITSGADNNIVKGNYIGINAAGTAAVSNGSSGVTIASGATNNTIGGTNAGEGNVVSGNNGDGILITNSGTTGNVVAGNIAGLNAAGSAAIANAFSGIAINGGAANNTIGGNVAGARNVSSGNGSQGIAILDSGSNNNVVKGNYTGLDVAGVTAIPNTLHGIAIWNSAQFNTVGGSSPSERNVSSGNTLSGIAVDGASNNTIAGNLIGRNATDTGDVANAQNGIALFGGAASNTIGGAAVAAGNKIAGHTAGKGISLSDASTSQNVIRNNTVTGNGKGVALTSTAGTGNRITENLIHGNTQIAIDLNDDLATGNDAGDADPGPNNKQNFPILSGASLSGSTLSVKATVNSGSATGAGLVIDLYKADASSPEQALTYLGSTGCLGTTLTNSTITMTVAGLAVNDEIVAAATNYNAGCTTLADGTSELSPAVTVSAPADLAITKTATASTVPTSSTVTYEISVFNGGPATATNLVVTDTLPANTSINDLDGGSWSCTDNAASPPTITCTLASLASAATSGTITIVANTPASANPAMSNTATVTRDQIDTNAANDSSSVTVAVVTPSASIGVSSMADSGPNTLRQAIEDANAGLCTEPCSITFTNGGTITPLTDLPTVDVAVNIDATGIIGYSGTPLVTLDGASCIGCDGIWLNGGASTLRGLSLINFTDALVLTGDGGHTVTANWIGVDPAGNVASNLDGIYVDTSSNIIGGATAADANVLSGNDDAGIWIESFVAISEGPVAHGVAGITGNQILGNYIGTNAASSSTIGNAGYGIYLGTDSGTTIIEGNTIAHNSDDGIYIASGTGHDIRDNSIHSNGNIGINLESAPEPTANDAGDGDTGPNNLQNAPVIASATIFGTDLDVVLSVDSSAVAYTQSFRIDVYESDGAGEGITHLGSQCVDGNNLSNVTVTVPVGAVTAGDEIVATATSQNANCISNPSVTDGTSEFSSEATAANCTPPSTTVSASGGTTFCTGGSVTLSAPTILGYTYQWYESGTPINAATAFSLNVTASGSYTVEVTNSSGCTAMSAATIVTVNPVPSAPTASNTGPYCEGQTVQLNASFVSGATYSWTGPNGFTSSLQNPTVAGATALSAGTYNVTVTVNGCTSAAASTTVAITATPSTPTASNTGAYCEGQTIQLNAATVAGATYSWTGPNGFSASVQNPTIANAVAATHAGTYTVTAFVNGCASASSSTTVVVNPIPSAPAATNTGAYCEGATIQLNASFISGASYAWTGPNGFTSTAQNPTINSATTANAGVYTVTATVNGCTSAASTTTVVVNAPPSSAVASNTGPYCENATIQLNATFVSGATYAWTGPNGFTSTLQNPTLTATLAAAGTYTVTTSANGCPSSSTSTTVVVNATPATPTASNSGPYCEGALVQLSAATVAGASYAWTGPNGFTSTAQNPSFTATAASAGVYTVTATVNGCTSAASTTTVVVNAVPDATISAASSTCANTSSNGASVASIAGATYAWSITNGTIDSGNGTNAITFSVTNTSPVTLNVTVTSNGCAASDTHVLTVGSFTPTITASGPTTFCTPNSVTLTSSAATSYQWYLNGTPINGETSNSITVFGGGSYTVEATGAGGCTGMSAPTVVTITSPPAPPAASNSGPYCEGGTIQLNASTIAGATYAWTGPNGFTSTLQNPTLAATAGAAGVYSVTATVNGCTTAASTTTVVVDAIPDATITAASGVCANSTNNPASAPFVSGATYAWSITNGTIDTGNGTNNITFSAATTSPVTLNLTVTSGACSASDTHTITVGAFTPTITPAGSASFCPGGSITLNASAATSYQWFLDNAPISGANGSSYVATAAGSYTVQATSGGCTGTSAPTVVTINTPPPGTPASNTGPYCEGQTIQLNVGSLGAGTTFAWTGPNGFTSTLQNPTLPATLAASGIYTVTVTAGSGCSSGATSTSVVVNALSDATITAPTGVCTNSTGNTAAAAFITGATYNWSITNGTITSGSGTNSITFSAGTASPVTLTLTISSNGCTASDTHTITVGTFTPSISASGPTTFCENGSVTLTSTTANSYQWYLNGAPINGAYGNSYIATSAGSYTVEATSGSCTGTSAPIVVDVTADANANITAPSSVSANSTGNKAEVLAQAGATYQWNIANGTITAGQFTNVVTFTAGASGSVTLSVVVTINDSCTGNDSAVIPITPSGAQQADFGVTKSAPSTVETGSSLTYTIVVSNAGPIASNAMLIDTLPAGVTVTSINDGPWNCTSSTSQIVCTGALAANGSNTIIVNTTAPNQVATIVNNVTIDADADDPNTANNSASATTEVTAAPTLCPTTPPSLLAPASNATVTSPATFSWSAVNGATSYELWLTSNGTTSLLGSTSSTSLAHAVASGTHSWFVIARLGQGCSALTSATRTFTVQESNTCANNAAPQMTAPILNASLTSPVTFAWTAVPQAIGYRLWITVDGGAPQDIGTTDGAITLTASVPAGTIGAFVDALFGGCPATRSTAVTFNVNAPDPCASRAAAAPIAPANNSTNNSSNVQFSWSAAANATSYRLWASVDGGAAQLLGTTTETSAHHVLERGEVIWWLEALYNGCASTESQRFRFLIPAVQNCGNERPQLLAPAKNSTTSNASVTFNWSAVTGAIGYQLWMGSANGTATLAGTTNAQTTSLTRLVAPGETEWYVVVLVDRCPSRESQKSKFTYTPPDACADNQRATPVSPLDGIESTSPVTFTWNAPANATKFELYVSRNNAAPALIATTTSTSAQNVSLATGALTWFVRTYFGNDCSPLDSSVSDLTIIPAPQECSELDAPFISAPGEISSGVPFLVQWNPIPGATAYQLQIANNAGFENAENITFSGTSHELVRTNEGSTPLAVYARVRAIDSRCVPVPSVSLYGPTSAIFIIPQDTTTGTVPAGESNIVQYTIDLGPELAGQTFTAIPTQPWLTVSPASGVIPAGGLTLIVSANTTALPLGASIGAINISLSGGTVASNATSVILPISINLVTPVAPTAKDTPPPDAMIIPAVASAAGINAQFQSDVRVSNTSSQLIKYQLSFVPSGEAGMSEGKQTTFSVEPGRTVALDDILKTWFGAGIENTVGSLEIRPLTQTSTSTSSEALGALANIVSFASSRTFNATSNGTFGQYIPAVPFANFLGKNAEDALSDILSLQQISQSAKFRTNVGFVEGSGERVDLLVSVFGSNGGFLGSFPVSLNGGQHTQLNLRNEGFEVEDGRVEVQIVGGGGKITAYASVLDNATADAILVTPVTLSQNGNTKWVIPGVADVATGFANWKSDMRIFNAGTEPVNITASFYSQNGGEPKVNTLTIDPGQVKQLDKVLPTLFNVTGDGGAVHLETAKPERLIATARTYNETSTGSYGLFASAVTPAEAVGVGSRPLQLLQVEESTRFRSNIGFAEVTGKPVTLEVTITPPDAKFTAVTEVTLNGNEFRQIGSLLGTLGLGDTYNARISVRAISGEGRATAYAAVIDMKTNDPTYVPAQ